MDMPVSPANIPVGDSCMTSECHVKIKRMPFLHGPLKKNECTPCHVQFNKNRHEFLDITNKRALCVGCHKPDSGKMVLHKPFNDDCTLCHAPHNADNRYFLKAGSGDSGCLQSGCHEKFQSDLTFKHKPASEEGCILCHSPHQSRREHLLTGEAEETCLSCHESVRTNLYQAVSTHLPEMKRNCMECHSPHGGATANFTSASGSDLCKKCHTEIFENRGKVRFAHGAMTEGRECRNCHTVHASEQSHLLTAKSTGLCMECHDKPVTVGTRVIPDIAEQLKTAPYVHGPVKEQHCSSCHKSHGSDANFLLHETFPTGFYAKYDSALYSSCFGCHNQMAIEADTSIRTNFRNGERNLHKVHVVGEKGRSCRVCHLSHAGSQPRMIRKDIPFGDWSIPIDFSQTESGGNCNTACHQEGKYDRFSPVVYAKKESGKTVLAPPVISRDQSLGKSSMNEKPIPSGLHRGDTAPPFSLPDLAWRKQNPMQLMTSPTLIVFLNPLDKYSARFMDEISTVFRKTPELSAKMQCWAVISNLEAMIESDAVLNCPADTWVILNDADGKGAAAYGSIATPTAFVVGTDRKILEADRGFGLEMANRISMELKVVLNLKTPLPGGGDGAKLQTPFLNMTRKAIERGLWDYAESLIATLEKDPGNTQAIQVLREELLQAKRHVALPRIMPQTIEK